MLMQRLAMLAAIGLCVVPTGGAGVLSPPAIGTRSQLFVDRMLVHETENVAFTLHQGRKHPENPLLTADQPWEGWRLQMLGNVIWDEEEGLFKMWYYAEEEQGFPGLGLYYATSKDGVYWEKPLIGSVRSKKYAKHNVLAEGILFGSVIKDPEEEDPARRYKMIGYDYKFQSNGYHTFISPDGLHWKRFSEERIAKGMDVISGYFDPRLKKYVAFPKIAHDSRGFRRRVFWLVTSEDFEHWTAPRLVLAPDARDDAGSLARIEEVRPFLDVPDKPELMRTEFYGVGAYPAESCTLAFVWVFTINNFHAKHRNSEGPGELQLAVSRDLVHWERPFRRPCVDRGASGEWDSGFFNTQSRALRVGDEVWLYYGGANYLHGSPCIYRAEGTGRLTEWTGSIGLAIWDVDRFVSVDAPKEGGRLRTVPIAFEGERLEVNAKVAGRLVVSLRDAGGRAYPGFEASDPIAGNDLRHHVRWKGKDDVSSLSGKPVMVDFEMEDAELFAFAFRE